MRVVADLHLHSRFSRGTSPGLDLPSLARAARLKGVGLLGTGDFTHPAWAAELERGLVPAGEGVYAHGGTRFLLTGEVSAVWTEGGRGRRVHLLLLVPSLEAGEKVRRVLARLGRLDADGRPVFGVSARTLAIAVWGAEPDAIVIPAHAWTPWFSVFGSRSGFGSLKACFGDLCERIFALETGLSSDPPMNRRVSSLDRLALVSFSDAHSPGTIAREATLFDLPEVSFPALVAALRSRDPERLLGTIEFFPEEGKYHFDGHRSCGIVFSPAESRERENLCPQCGKPLTLGVLHRVEDLADREEGGGPVDSFRHLVPLGEVLAQALGVGTGTKRVAEEYDRLIHRLGSELSVLLDASDEDLAAAVSGRVLEAIRKARRGEVRVEPGYDGVFGKVTIPFAEEEKDLPLF
jgi:uncharacterized protein (TIGR00375 family)